MRIIIKWVINIISVLMLIVIIVLSILNIDKTGEAFFDITFVQALTLLITFFLTIFVNQFFNNDKKINENIEKIAFNIQNAVTKKSFYEIDSSNFEFTKDFSMLKKRISNQISILMIYNKKVSIKKYISYIDSEFNKYTGLVSDHINDLDYLSKSKKELFNYSQNIDFKCEEMISFLYK